MRRIAIVGLVFAAAAGTGLGSAPAHAAAPLCPATITVDIHIDLQGKPLPPGGWSDDKRETGKLTAVAFYTGHRGEELKASPAQLKPEQKEENKKMTESWAFAPGSPVLVICHYKGTEMKVGIEMPQGVQSCEVVMTRSGSKSYHTAGTAAMSCK
jgi:hypothetical protein